MIRLGFATLRYTPNGCETTFRDGATWGSYPHPDNIHYSVIAHRCGYADDLLKYCREHELAHHLVGEWLYKGPSPVIWALAHGEEIPPEEAALEEMAAMTLQRFVRGGERPIVGGINWDEMRDHFLEAVR